MKNYDLFISHASQNKDEFVREFAKQLDAAGYKCFYDETTINVGDSIRSSIDKGLYHSDLAVVVISKEFLSRPWPQAELDAILNLAISKDKKLIPIWLNVSYEDVSKASPILADRKAILFDGSVSRTVEAVGLLIPKTFISLDEADAAVKRISLYPNHEYIDFLATQAIARMEAFYSITKLYDEAIDDFSERYSEEDVEYEHHDESEWTMWWEKALVAHNLPSSVHTPEGSFEPDNLQYARECLTEWFAGVMTSDDVGCFYSWLDEIIDADWIFVLFGIPNYEVGLDTRNFLIEAVFRLGTRFVGLPEDFKIDGWLFE